ncbi:hypothetical protein HW555_011218 [Spodoptera exigua]|uniref:Regulatory protein zeste n=1 Tax=Spodoptera exigua TaxID=7107 RepID=A0A835G7F1_SPOEX|nr:hypothetical protein HW555_011218 [Spodoptera exigua]
MERRKASPEQLNMLLHFLEEDKELAIGKFTGLEGRIRQTNAWITITEKLNANSGFGSGAIKTPDKWQQAPTQSTGPTDDMCGADPSTSNMKWPSDSQHFTPADIEMSLGDGVVTDPDAGMGPNEVSSAPVTGKPLWKRGRPVRLVHDRLLNLEEERIRIEKQKLLEKKRCNNIRLKMEKDRLEIERQRNVLLEKLLVAVEAVAHR